MENEKRLIDATPDDCIKLTKHKTNLAKIIVSGTADKPYYCIMWFDYMDRQYHIGYGSYNLRFVFQWLSECFEIEEAPTVDAATIPETGIGDLSDGYHTFNELYYQRLILFAALVRQHTNRAWKSFRHEDGELCFGGGWFIVGIDTPEGSYTYHYENKHFDLFDCVELPVAKHWDGHTEKDVTRLLSLSCDEAQRWIPVTERMPELIPCTAGTAYSEAVNVLTSGRKVVTAIWDGTEFIADAAFWEADGETITHWAPVPLPLPELAGG